MLVLVWVRTLSEGPLSAPVVMQFGWPAYLWNVVRSAGSSSKSGNSMRLPSSYSPSLHDQAMQAPKFGCVGARHDLIEVAHAGVGQVLTTQSSVSAPEDALVQRMAQEAGSARAAGSCRPVPLPSFVNNLPKRARQPSHALTPRQPAAPSARCPQPLPCRPCRRPCHRLAGQRNSPTRRP